ncbi:Na/Pi cotransporter family protein [Massilia glaciei]|nr:Na/Pi symporter [Massilia glaciei]
MIGPLTGGIGLFLLGMWLMTDGMKMAAGPALERILANATRTRLRGLGSGILVTSVVQSSSAVTVAAIGFVNAGLLTLGQSLWVLFGANVGTSMTGWLVAAAGMGFKIEAAALPLVGVGMLLHLTGGRRRRGAIGMAIAGFGILFLGIDILKTGFTDVAGRFALPAVGGALGVVMHVFAGLVLTVMMQSSSAALAVALTAAQGGLLPLEAAAAVVIGANLGTTVTAVIAAVGATVNARRAAAAHVMFNVLTGALALLILPWLLDGIIVLRDMLALDRAPGITLALFHTTFNVLGVFLMWPLAGRLTTFLQARFRSHEEDMARPHFLDQNLVAVPSLAVIALERELGRLGAMAVGMLRSAMAGEAATDDAESRAQVVGTLKLAIGKFVQGLNRASMSDETSHRLSRLLRVLRYYDSVAQLARAMAATACEPPASADRLLQQVRGWLAQVDLLCAQALVSRGPALMAMAAAADGVEAAYQALKAELLQAGAEGEIDIGSMESLLQRCSLARRGMQQAIKAANVLSHLDDPWEPARAADGTDDEADD